MNYNYLKDKNIKFMADYIKSMDLSRKNMILLHAASSGDRRVGYIVASLGTRGLKIKGALQIAMNNNH